MTRVSFSCVALVLSTLPSAAGDDDLYRCTIKDVVEITSLGTIGRRPTLTQAEMTMHPTFTVERSTGTVRTTRLDPRPSWLLLQHGNDQEDLVTVMYGSAQNSRVPAEVIRIQAGNGKDGTYFLWFSTNALRTGDCVSN